MHDNRLKDRHLKLKSLKEDEYPLIVNSVPSNDVYIVEKDNDQKDESTSILDEYDIDVDLDLFENVQGKDVSFITFWKLGVIII